MGITVKPVQFTSLGTGTTKTQLTGADVAVPEWAKKLLAIKVSLCPLTPKANIAYQAKFFLDSEDVAGLKPFIALAPPVSAGDNVDISLFVPPKAEYVVNCPVNGGEKLKIYGQMLTGDGTAAVYMGMDLIFGSAGALLPIYRDPLKGRQRHAKVGTQTVSVTAGVATGTDYEITGASRIVELLGMVTVYTVASSKPTVGKFGLTSSGFALDPVGWTCQPCSSALVTAEADSNVACLSRIRDVDIPLKAPHVIISDSYEEVVGQNTDKWITGVVYI